MGIAEIQAAILGVVEGLTEFLPVSSTGHLIIAGDWIGFEKQVGAEFAQRFDVIIQLGAILAVIACFPRRFAGLVDLRRGDGFRGWRGLMLLFLTTLPAALAALALEKKIKGLLFAPLPVAAALAAGALWIMAVEWRRPKARFESIDTISPALALGIGLFQCLALWPGMSRAAATILGGMLLGLDRRTATEYSFFAAVPVLTAAAAHDFLKGYHVFVPQTYGLLAIGFIVSFVCAWIAVRFLLHFVSRHSLVAFAWYRLALAAVVVAVFFLTPR